MQTTEVTFKKTVFNDGVFFVGLMQYGVMVGRVGGASLSVPNGHAWHDRVAETTTLAEAQGYFDELMEAFGEPG